MPIKTICVSHAPFYGITSPGEPVEGEVRGGFAALAAAVEDFDPELVVLFAPDHLNGFFYGLMPPFCLGVRASSIGDYATKAGPLQVPEEEALALHRAVSAEGIDLPLSYRMQVDHGFAQPLEVLTGAVDRRPVLPIFINAVAPPRPSWRRVRRLGEAVGRFALGTGKRVLVIGSGGLSHDPPVPSLATAPPEVAEMLIGGAAPDARQQRQERTLKAGADFAAGNSPLRALNDVWDLGVLDHLAAGDLDAFEGLDDEEVTASAGRAAHEVRTWVAAFAAQSAAGSYDAELLYYRMIPEWIVGMGMIRAGAAEGPDR